MTYKRNGLSEARGHFRWWLFWWLLVLREIGFCSLNVLCAHDFWCRILLGAFGMANPPNRASIG
jgi:hypothetical protein